MLIVDMPMPKNCHECEAKCVNALYGRICGMTRKNIIPFLDKPNRPDWCPIKGVLPDEHGDLVDADTVLLEVPDSKGILPPMTVTIGDVIEGYYVPIVIAAERSKT